MRGYVSSRADVVFYLLNSSIQDIFLVAAILGVLGGAWGTLVHMIIENKKNNAGVEPDSLAELQLFGSNLGSLTVAFTFLPVFLLGFFVNRESSRWVGFIDLTFSVWGRIEDLALIMAGAVQGVHDEKVMNQRREYLFTAYRYLNAVHFLTYYGLDERAGSTPDEVVWDLICCGLLDTSEGKELVKSPHKMRQVVLSRLSCLWSEMLLEGAVPDCYTTIFMEKLTALRGSTVLHLEQESSIVKVMLKAVTVLLTLFIVVSYPWNLNLAGQCFQPFAILATFLLNLCYIGLLVLMATLSKTPFNAGGECINVDNILCEVEKMTFHCMREKIAGAQSFRNPEPEGMPPLPDKSDNDSSEVEFAA
jgi:hypothetical protein